jgi:hypothetical protein
MAYTVYTAELARLSRPVIIIVTSWKTPDGVLHAEWFVIQGTQFASERIICDKINYPELPFESEDDLMVEALRRAREHLQGKRDMLPEQVRSKQEKKRLFPFPFLTHAWLRGRATAFREVASKTGCAELRDQLSQIIRLPIIFSPDEGLYTSQ